MSPSSSSSTPEPQGPEGPRDERVDGLASSSSEFAKGATAASEASSDPIYFQDSEPTSQPSKKGAMLVWQFFLFPLLIVGIAVGLFILFGALGSSQKTPHELVKELLNGGENTQKQAGQQLAIEISKERTRVDEESKAGTYMKGDSKPAFYRDPEFRSGLQEAYLLARKEESEDRQNMLARALGRAHVTEAIPLLLGTLYPDGDAREAPQVIRRAAAIGIMFMEDRKAESALLRMTKEKIDPEVRNIAFNGLATLGLPRFGGGSKEDPRVLEVLRKGLDDAKPGVRLNAAYGLAWRGNGAGRALIEQSLSRKSLEQLNVPDEMRSAALANGVRAAYALGDESLRPLVVQLTLDDQERDDQIRDLARRVLKDWRTN